MMGVSRNECLACDTGNLLLGEIEEIADSPLKAEEKLQSVCNLLKEGVEHYDWVGFYLVDPESKRELILGPFAGEHTEHTRIPFGKGICGQAAERKETFVVQDVSAQDNYLSCSMHVKAEIVLPLFKDGEVVGELDIDSHSHAPFGEADKIFLENVCKVVSRII